MTEDKPYKLTLIDRDLYVYAHIKADTVTREISSQYLAEIVEACKGYGKSHLMIYRDIPEMLSAENIKGVGTTFLEIIGGIRTAAVNPYLSEKELLAAVEHLPEANTYRIFTNFRDAEAWLLNDDML
jgi:hypothetical protein